MPEKGLFDIHCHIVPSVDDGASSADDAYKMLQMEYRQGVRNIIATPHFRNQMFETPRHTINQQFWLLRELAHKVSPDLRVYLGCEFHSNMEMVEMLRSGEIHTMAGSRYVLTEFSGSSKGSYIRDRLYSLISHGYKPIVAHIERYECLRKDIKLVEELTDMGAYMQVNADSILGKEGFGIKRYCKKLLKQDLISFVGSDCHGIKERVSHIGDTYAYIAKKEGEEYADQLFINNPQKILADAQRRKEK